VVTSRNRLTGLIAVDGAHPLTLDLLTPAEARQLLAGRLGTDRVTAEPGAVDELIELCARLPLAMAVAAAHAGSRPGVSLAALATELREARNRLDALTGDDSATDIRSVFACSYHTLSVGAARLFRLLGLHPGPETSAAAAASLAGIPPEQITPLLSELTRAHLATESRPGRYTFHDLLRAYATEQAHTEETETERHGALHRVLDHYLHTAYAADRRLDPNDDPVALSPPHTGVTAERPTDQAHALEWFTSERPVLLTAIAHAADAGFDAQAWQLARACATFLHRQGHWRSQLDAQRAAVAAARRLTEPSAQVHAHRSLAKAYVHLGLHDDAYTHFQEALDLARRAGDLVGQAHTHYTVSMMWERRGRHDKALDHAVRALELSRASGHPRGQANALNAVGWYHALLGHHQKAISHCERALILLEELGDAAGQAATWDTIGYAHHHLGRHDRAVACYRRSVKLFHTVADRYNEADVLSRLGDTHLATGDCQAACHAWQRTVTILRDIDHPGAERIRAKLDDLAHQHRPG
jgi:tetratricopeptide (TPR) repeat protein